MAKNRSTFYFILLSRNKVARKEIFSLALALTPHLAFNPDLPSGLPRTHKPNKGAPVGHPSQSRLIRKQTRERLVCSLEIENNRKVIRLSEWIIEN